MPRPTFCTSSQACCSELSQVLLVGCIRRGRLRICGLWMRCGMSDLLRTSDSFRQNTLHPHIFYHLTTLPFLGLSTSLVLRQKSDFYIFANACQSALIQFCIPLIIAPTPKYLTTPDYRLLILLIATIESKPISATIPIGVSVGTTKPASPMSKSSKASMH